jgi:molybdopterin-binding protein
MKISARNVIRGTVTKINRGPIEAELSIEVAPGLTIYSTIGIEAIERLEIAEGDETWAAFEASSVMIGVPHHKRGE